MLAPDESAAGKRNGARLNWYLEMHGWCLNYVNHLAYNSNRHFGHLSTTAATTTTTVTTAITSSTTAATTTAAAAATTTANITE